MSSQPRKNIPALEIAQCPNCGYAIEQLGARTNCRKCGKRITILCISCQTNNPPIFQNCMQCAQDFRVIGVEHFHKQLAKLDFDLGEFERQRTGYQRAAALEQWFKITAYLIAAIMGIINLMILPFTVSFVVTAIILAWELALLKLLSRRVALLIAGLPKEFDREWRYLSAQADRDKQQKMQAEKEIEYYQHELNLFRQRKN